MHFGDTHHINKLQSHRHEERNQIGFEFIVNTDNRNNRNCHLARELCIQLSIIFSMFGEIAIYRTFYDGFIAMRTTWLSSWTYKIGLDLGNATDILRFYYFLTAKIYSAMYK